MVKRKISALSSQLTKCNTTPIVPSETEQHAMRKFLELLPYSCIKQLNVFVPSHLQLMEKVYSVIQPGFWACGLAIAKLRGWMGNPSTTTDRYIRRSEEKNLVEHNQQQSQIDSQCMKHSGWVLVRMNIMEYKHVGGTTFDFHDSKIVNWFWMRYVDSSPCEIGHIVIVKSDTHFSYTTARHPMVDPTNHLQYLYRNRRYGYIGLDDLPVVARQLEPSTNIGIYYSPMAYKGLWVGHLMDDMNVLPNTDQYLYHTRFTIDTTALYQLDFWLHIYPPRVKMVLEPVKRRRLQHSTNTPEWIMAFPYELWLLIGLYFVSYGTDAVGAAFIEQTKIVS